MSSGIRTREATKEYREGWDLTFRKSEKWKITAPCGTVIYLSKQDEEDLADFSKPGGLDVRTEVLSMKLQDHRGYCSKCLKLKSQVEFPHLPLDPDHKAFMDRLSAGMRIPGFGK